MNTPTSSTRIAAAPARAECRIDLGALQHNIRSLAARLEGDARFWAVVKANAYGHDVDQVAEAAITAGVRRLCVATLSEAWHLRQSGVRVPLLVMGPLEAASLRRAIDLDVSVTVLSSQMIDALESVSPSRTGKPARVHLKLDTGMGRWGIPLAELGAALDRLEAIAGVEIEGVMTHFATADDPSSGFFTQQVADFSAAVAAVRTRHPAVIAHAANSAAIVADPRAHFDAVRCGVAMYGLSPTQGNPDDHDPRPVLSLRSFVADIRERSAGDSVGYSRTFVAERDCRVALVPVGYADGVRRALSNRGQALVGGRRLDYVGNVSMDHITLLIGDDDNVNIGDVVTLIGSDGDQRVTAEEHAAWADTINYEITCGIAGEPRLRRLHDAGNA